MPGYLAIGQRTQRLTPNGPAVARLGLAGSHSTDGAREGPRGEVRTIQVLAVFHPIGVLPAEPAAHLERVTVRPPSTNDPDARPHPHRGELPRDNVCITSLYPEEAAQSICERRCGIFGPPRRCPLRRRERLRHDSTMRGPDNFTAGTRLPIAPIRHRGFAPVPDGQRHWSRIGWPCWP